jgi:hypothetical protein
MQAWWSEATKDPGNDAGGFTVGSFKGVLHTTEGRHPSFGAARHEFVVNNSWPHFTVSFESGAFQAWQHVPVTKAARSLKHPRGTVETNRARAIQIEIVAGATHINELPPGYLVGLAQLMRWIEAQVGVTRSALPFEAYPASFGLHNGVRLDAAKWLAFNGWCGHQHVPFNDHGDPGAINIKKLVAAPQPVRISLPVHLVAAGPSAVATGVDRAGAPSLAEAKAIRAGAEAKWWGVYIGGPCSGGSGWTPRRVRELATAGFEFLPIYVGRQSARICHRNPLRAASQAVGDAREAVHLMGTYDWQPNRNIPVCLDVEAGTFAGEATLTLDYIANWVQAVRAAGYRPGVYSSPSCLTALSRRPKSQQPDFVWVAAWLLNGTVNHSLDPRRAHGMPDAAWRNQRAWQYAGSIGVTGGRHAVDVSCSNLVHAPAPGGTARLGTDPVLQLGSSGPAVTVLKQLLHAWGKTNPLPQPLADTPLFGQAVLAAVKKFQRLNGIQPSGKVGGPTWRALRAAVAHPAAKARKVKVK